MQGPPKQLFHISACLPSRGWGGVDGRRPTHKAPAAALNPSVMVPAMQDARRGGTLNCFNPKAQSAPQPLLPKPAPSPRAGRMLCAAWAG
jgi:hypothetical protein